MNKFCYNCMMPLDNDKCGHCGYTQFNKTPVHHLYPSTILNNRYYIGNAIGQGGFGITYIGRDLNLDMIVAVKEFFPNGYVNRNNNASSKIEISGEKNIEFFNSGKKRFIREAKLLAKFSGNKSIVDVRDYFEENNTGYIVMEYVNGETLTKHLKLQGKFSPDNLLDKMFPLFSALGTIHKSGLIHRDISPDNIMLLSDGTLKLMDFGAARYINFLDNHTMSIMFKPGYAPEEQYRQKGSQGSWTDVYAICATMYKCVTGETPDDSMERAFKDNLKKPSLLSPDITAEYEAVLLKGMAVYKENRFQNMEELSEAFIKATGKEYSDLSEGTSKNSYYSIDPENDKTILYSEEEDFKTEYYKATEQRLAEEQKVKSESEVKTIKKSRKKLIIPIILSLIISIISILYFVEQSNYIKTPNLTKLEKAKAEKALKSNELKFKEKYEYSDTVKKGKVISQKPPKSQRIKKGSSVNLIISKGKLVAVPNVTKMRYSKAELMLSNKGLNSKITKKIFSDKIKKNHIISQSPKNGDSIPEGSIVSVELSKGKRKYMIQNLIGKNYKSAEKTLKYFKTAIKYEYSNKPKNTVIKQSPAPGKKLIKNSKVILTVSKGSAPTIATTAATAPRVRYTAPTKKNTQKSFSGLNIDS